MFNERKLAILKNRIQQILNDIHKNLQECVHRELILFDIYQHCNEELLEMYEILYKMKQSKYLYLYKRIYFYRIFPTMKKIILFAGVNIHTLQNFYEFKLDSDFKYICSYLTIYRVKFISNSPEIDEELKLNYKLRKPFFWNSYPYNTKTIEEQIHGVNLYIPFSNKYYLLCNAIVDKDAQLYCQQTKIVQQKMSQIDSCFSKYYFLSLSLKDILVNDTKLFSILMKNATKEVERYSNKNVNDLQREFKNLNVLKQRKIIILLSCSLDNDDNLKAKVLYESCQINQFPSIVIQKLNLAKKCLDDNIKNFEKTNDINVKEKILLLKAPDNVKQKAFEKLRDANSGREVGSKAQQYIDGLLKIPFGVYIEEPIFKQFSEIKK